MDIFQELFGYALQEAATVYSIQRITKGDGWKGASLWFIRLKLSKEIREYETVDLDDPNAERLELIDIINVALMLVERINEEGKNWIDKI